MNPRTRRAIVTAVLILVIAAVIIGSLIGEASDVGAAVAAQAH